MKLSKEPTTTTFFVDEEKNFKHDFSNLVEILEALDGNIRITDKKLATYLISIDVVEYESFFKQHHKSYKYEEFYNKLLNLI